MVFLYQSSHRYNYNRRYCTSFSKSRTTRHENIPGADKVSGFLRRVSADFGSSVSSSDIAMGRHTVCMEQWDHIWLNLRLRRNYLTIHWCPAFPWRKSNDPISYVYTTDSIVFNDVCVFRRIVVFYRHFLLAVIFSSG